jgi:hypothetical protein
MLTVVNTNSGSAEGASVEVAKPARTLQRRGRGGDAEVGGTSWCRQQCVVPSWGRRVARARVGASAGGDGREGASACFMDDVRQFVWQNRLNYSGSSVLVIAIRPILTQRTSNGTTHWSVGSPPARYNHGSTGSGQVYLARRRVYNHTIAHQLLITEY